MKLEACADCELIECDHDCQIYIDVKAEADFEIKREEGFYED
jgi:hypothetical protein